MGNEGITTSREMSFKEKLDDMRKQLKNIALYIKTTKDSKVNEPVNETEDIDEELANLTLAYRHIEDASMRIGKTLQALAGGDSIYDNNAVGTPIRETGTEAAKRA